MSSRSRVAGSESARNDALAALVACRRRKESADGDQAPRRIDTFKVREEERVYDVVGEAEYAKIVAQKRAEAGEFVVGDDDMGYNDLGEDDWHRYDDQVSDDEDDDPESRIKKAQKAAAARAARQNAAQRRKQAQFSEAAALVGQNRGVSAMFRNSAASRARGAPGAGLPGATGAGAAKKGIVGARDADEVLDEILADMEEGEGQKEKRRRRVGGTVRVAAPQVPQVRNLWNPARLHPAMSYASVDPYELPPSLAVNGEDLARGSMADTGSDKGKERSHAEHLDKSAKSIPAAPSPARVERTQVPADLSSPGPMDVDSETGHRQSLPTSTGNDNSVSHLEGQTGAEGATKNSADMNLQGAGTAPAGHQGGPSTTGDDGDTSVEKMETPSKPKAAFNAVVEEADAGDVARASWHSRPSDISPGEQRLGESSAPEVHSEAAPHLQALDLPLSEDGTVPFFFLDAHEETMGPSKGTVFLFGKVPVGDGAQGKGQGRQQFASCCVLVTGMNRTVFLIPKPGAFSHVDLSELEEKAKTGTDAEKVALRMKLQEMAGPLKAEVADVLMERDVSTFSMVPVKRSYAFENPDIPRGENYCLKLQYPFSDAPLPADLTGETFCTVLGTHTSALELLLLKRRIMGPCWLSLANAQRCSSTSHKSHCKVELWMDNPKGVSVSQQQQDFPPLSVASLSMKTVVNSAKNLSEVAAVSVVHCSGVRVDRPMVRNEWDNPRSLGHFSAFRRLEGVGFPVGLDAELARRSSMSGSKKGSERELLSYLLARLARLDADVIVGHGLSSADLEVLLHRMQVNKVGNWSVLGRLRRTQMPRLQGGGGGGGGGASLGVMVVLAGRLLCDTALAAREVLREVSYSLTHLAHTQLKTGVRREISAAQVPGMYSTVESLLQMVECNETDAWLSLALMFHLSTLPLTRQLTNLSGNLWSRTLQGARAQRIEYLLLHEFHRRKFLLPDKMTAREKEAALSLRDRKRDSKAGKGKGKKGGKASIPQASNTSGVDAPEFGDDAADDEEGHPGVGGEDGSSGNKGRKKKGPSYAGGLVLEPKRGLYDKFILLLDFNSLYPSIIQEFNICFTSVSPCPTPEEGEGEGGSIPPLPALEPQGVLPQVLCSLVQKRRQVKELLKRESDPGERQRLDIRQQALKLTANSMYGCLGFSNSRFFARPLAELVTSLGREILQSTVNLVQGTLNLEVIYGDTDSIMVNTGLQDAEAVLKMGQRIKKEVNKRYKLLEIDIDGIFRRMLLLNKKKYAAVKLDLTAIGTGQLGNEVTEQKGLDIVRRDWSLLAKQTGNFCLNKILSGGSVEDVLEAIHTRLRNLAESVRQGKEPLTSFAITKALTKDPKDYPDAKSQPHVQVALRRLREGHREGCRAGDTVQYVICKPRGAEGAAQGGMAERARSVQELKEAARKEQGGGEGSSSEQWDVDVEYYLAHQVHPVVARLCATIEGTDSARLAECLGLDPGKFRHSVFNATSTQAATEDALLSAFSAKDDEDRYRHCDPLWLTCPSCKQHFPFPGIKHLLAPPPPPSAPPLQPQHPQAVSADASGAPGSGPHEQGDTSAANASGAGTDPAASGGARPTDPLHCPSCKNEGARVAGAMLANQVKLQVNKLLAKYQDGWLRCSEETCGLVTRDVSMKECLHTENGPIKGSVCPNHPKCEGNMWPQVSEGAVYKQLQWFIRLLDLSTAVQRLPDQKRPQVGLRLAPLVPMFEAAAHVVRKHADRFQYKWVNIDELCVSMELTFDSKILLNDESA